MDDPTTAPAARTWPRPFLDALAADARVIGAAEVAADGSAAPPPASGAWRALVVVTTWDGRDAIAGDLTRLGALALGAEPVVARHDGVRWTGVSEDWRRVELEVVRIGDLKPSARGECATVVHDTKRLMEQWVRWSAGRDRSREVPPCDRTERLVALDGALRRIEGPPGPQHARTAALVRGERAALSLDAPAERALAERADAALRSCPHDGAGYRVVPGTEGPAAALDSFLRVADGEGFLGDRVLFDAAVKRLAELARRTPEFDEGFVLPSFDAVEARWRFGHGIGGCKTPLVPGVYVGVGVTPADHLEFWAAPFVREPQCDVACVADPGTRVVRERTAGKDAFFAALLGEVDRAWEELPDFLRTARRAGRTPAGDVEEALRPLHLPRSYREAAKRRVVAAGAPSRLQVALALARAGSAEEPVNARKFGLAAGRFVALTPPGADDGCDA